MTYVNVKTEDATWKMYQYHWPGVFSILIRGQEILKMMYYNPWINHNPGQ